MKYRNLTQNAAGLIYSFLLINFPSVLMKYYSWMWFILVGKSFQELEIGRTNFAEDQDSDQ
jgi:hypothetical protein